MSEMRLELGRDGAADVLRVYFRYNPGLVEGVRSLGAKFSRVPEPHWSFPVPMPRARDLRTWLSACGFRIGQDVDDALLRSIAAALPEPERPASSGQRARNLVHAERGGTHWLVSIGPGPRFAAALELVKGLPVEQRQWSAPDMRWRLRVSGPSTSVVGQLRQRGWDFTADAETFYLRLTEPDAGASFPEYPAPPDNLPGLEDMRSASGYSLKPFQRRGVARAVTWKGSINAFQVGLGKTITALAAARIAGAFPLIVVCQASKKLDWAEEAAEWIPGRLVEVIDGRGSYVYAGADIYIVNYDVLQDGKDKQRGRAAQLAALKPRMVVLDESQLIKERSAGRTRAALKLAAAAEYRLLLSGTAVKNRPGELITQLEAVGGLGDFGGVQGFRQRYCVTSEMRIGGAVVDKEGDGARNAIELHERLSRRWYFRLTKTEVLPELPPVRRHVVPLAIDNEEEYIHARDRFLRWVYDASLTDVEYLATLPADWSEAERSEAMREHARERQERASRAQQLAQINALKRVAARGMLGGVIRWIDDFIKDGSKLIVFAHHKDIQRELFAAFPGSARLSAADDDAGQHVHKHRFQTDPDCPLIVVSMAVGATGHTLTAAHACAFVELAWTPADHDQGEGRAYGRMNDPHGLDSYWLVADGTIYADILQLLDSKRAVVDAILDGLAPEGSDDILGDLMKRLRAAARATPPLAPPPRPAALPPALQPAREPLQPALFPLNPSHWAG